MASEALKKFVHNAIFLRQVKSVDDIQRQARKSGLGTTRNEIYRAVEEVCTPYKSK